jgi:hypothetical protein
MNNIFQFDFFAIIFESVIEGEEKNVINEFYGGFLCWVLI